MKEFTIALADPRGFIARLGQGVEHSLYNFFTLYHEGCEDEGGRILVAKLTGLPPRSINRCLKLSTLQAVADSKGNDFSTPRDPQIDTASPVSDYTAGSRWANDTLTASSESTWVSASVKSAQTNSNALSSGIFSQDHTCGSLTASLADPSKDLYQETNNVRSKTVDFLLSYPGVSSIGSVDIVF
jgi:hypothetical protein